MYRNTFLLVAGAVTFVLFATILLPDQTYAQTFSYNTYPNNGYRASGCISGFCASGYQYNPTNYGFQFTTQGMQIGYRYGQPIRKQSYQQRSSYRPYIPYVVIQRKTPTYYQRSDPYAFRRDFNQAASEFTRELRYYTNY